MNNHASPQKTLLRFFCVGLMTLATLFIIATVARAENKKPRAAIDGDVNVKVGDTVYLNADLSSDPDDDTLSYAWTITSWPEGGQALTGRDRRFQFDATVAGKYEVRLVVNDGMAESDPCTLTVSATEK